MASGFLVLPDGRCFARYWQAYDYVLRAIINELKSEPSQHELQLWLEALLPGPRDIDELGFGAWFREADKENVMRELDMRQLAKCDQDAICSAVLRMRQALPVEDRDAELVNDFAEMVEAYQRGEPPLSNSDWTSVPPPEEGHIGPGWKHNGR